MVGAIIGGIASSLISGAMNNNARNKQNDEEWKRMEWGATENEAMAIRNHQRNKDMWDYTNYENQLKHMKQAGLSPGLMYGGAGAGVTSSQGGHGGSPNTMIPQGVERGLQEKQIALQLGQLASQIDVNKSVAEKNEAEAEKTRGADTEVAKSKTELNKELAKIQDGIDKMNKAKTQLTAAEYFTQLHKQTTAWEESRSAAVKADIDEATKENIIEKTSYETMNSMLSGIESIARIKLTEEQTEMIKQKVSGYWYELTTNRMTSEAAKEQAKNVANRIVNDLNLGTRKLDQQDERLLQDWIYRGVHAAWEINDGVGQWIGNGLKKAVQKGIKKVTSTKSNGKSTWTEDRTEWIE
ncbi:MAG: DNA pilot protein [Microviridae sp.]|nr:MAG: DNA pilot protein [Microviridae sp.]